MSKPEKNRIQYGRTHQSRTFTVCIPYMIKLDIYMLDLDKDSIQYI